MDSMMILADVTSEPADVESNGGEMKEVVSQPSDVNAPGGVARRSPMGPYSNFIFLGLLFVVMYFVLFRGPRKKQQQHNTMVQTLKKNDRVRTIGGILGTVVDVRDDDVVLKIDESTNTKIHIVKSAIGVNLSLEKKE